MLPCMQSTDEFFMRQALEEARKAFVKGEVPVGAVLVCSGKVMARAHNLLETTRDPTAHAEVLCLRQGALHAHNWRLADATLYCTLEPCCMCCGAMIQARIRRLVWGAVDKRQGVHGSWIDVRLHPHPIHQFVVSEGVLAEECGQILRSFFQERREGLVAIPQVARAPHEVIEELVKGQQEKVLRCAREILPYLTEDDILQPNDFPALEEHPYFRYEEGVLEGLLAARMALRASDKT